MLVKKDNILKVMKNLEKIEKEYGYRALEIAFLIDANTCGEEITEKQIDDINSYIDGLDRIIDEEVDYEVRNILEVE